jgi:ribosomal protein L11 methyltransferase
MRWAEIAVETTCASADAVSEILMQQGCGGTVISCSSASAFEDATTVRAYLPVNDSLEGSLDTIRERVRALPTLGLETGSGDIAVRWVEDDDWATAWRKYFKPIRFGRVVVKPSWEDYSPEPDDVVVEIDPGMAFGTGNHPTTALCLQLLQEIVSGGEIVLDVGTGSGILAIAAAKLGASSVTGIDIDPVAVEAARGNVEMNGLHLAIEVADSPAAYEGTADIVVANIVPNVIIGMADALCSKVAPGGTLVTSGIVVERAGEVRARLESLGMELLNERREGDWVALIHRKRR